VGPDPQLEAVIAAVPAWRGHEPAITPIEAGRTNRNYRVDVGTGTFFLRLSHEDTALLGIDRVAEYEAALAAAAAGVGPEVVAHLPEHGCLITVWVPGEPLTEGDMEQGSVLAEVVRVVSTIHAGPALPTTFDAFRVVEEYRRVSEERGVAIPDAYEPAHARAERIEAALARAPVPPCPCHNDLLADNFLKGTEGFWLVDFEYSGMGDPFFDLGNLSINNGLSEASQERLLLLMFGEPTDAHRARLQLMRIMSDYREAMWGVIQQGLSTLDIDYVAYADRHFDRLSRSMADERFEGWLEQSAEAI
jgi:thiamine kinase-like enzyme